MTLLNSYDIEEDPLLSSDSSNITLTPSSSEYRACRYCLEYVNENVKYCNCTGSHGYVHYECLVRWYEFNNYSITKCELCNSNFKIKVVKDISVNAVLNTIMFILISILLISINIIFFYVIPYYGKEHFISSKKYHAMKIALLLYSSILFYFNYINYKAKKNIH